MKSVEDLEQVLKAAAQSPEQVLFITGMFPPHIYFNLSDYLCDYSKDLVYFYILVFI